MTEKSCLMILSYTGGENRLQFLEVSLKIAKNVAWVVINALVN